ncbi:DUF3626 domain-containing protein [Amycolatopsis sp. H20-H5]|uniref:DUF3626 domain-containing protein n=1 Tax=Amycolatopsis sp. H20-H5 TaxID=3046309 RepID=UPI002DB6F701|nr:DUF3626 domain-containing protein [Amycolatopsis sp. H20-H5]MEC3981269.1 DUF3626 domain-containing protein [Amycolatopsis sp. H20-H5]
MAPTTEPFETAPWRRALAQIAGLASGPPLADDLDVTLHFHPDRPAGELLQLSPGTHPPRYEAGTTNTGLTAHPGDDRVRWEHSMFAGAYDRASSAQRPKYGSLNHHRHPAGGSPRFGSAHLRLARQTLRRTTFSYPGGTDLTAVATAEHMPLIASADSDHHIEAHVHGALRLNRDIEAVVLDPSYRGTEIETAAAALPFPTEWHDGFRLHVDQLGGDELTNLIAVDGWLDARIIGDAVRAGRYDAEALDGLWHCVAKHGYLGPDLRENI